MSDFETLLARASEDEETAAALLQAVAGSLPRDVLVEAAGAIPRCKSPQAGSTVLGVLAQELPRRARKDLLHEILGERTSAVGVEQAARLPPELHRDALAAAAKIPDEHLRSEVLSELAPRLSPELLPLSMEIIGRIESPTYRCRALGAVAPRLPAKLRAITFSRALEAAAQAHGERAQRPTVELELSLPRAASPTGSSASSDVGHLARWAPHLDRSELRRAFELVEGFESPALRLVGLASLAGGLGEDERAELLERLLREAAELPEGDQLKVVRAMAPHLPPRLRGAVRRRLEELDRGLVELAAPDLGLPAEAQPTRGLPAEAWQEPAAEPAGKRGTGRPSAGLSRREAQGVAALSVGDQIRLGTAAINALERPAASFHFAAPDSEGIVARLREKVDAGPERVVSTGFAGAAQPQRPRPADLPLATGERYLFWLEIGPPVEGSIEEAPGTIDLSALPSRARLTVALFPVSGEPQLEPGARVGELELGEDGEVRVARLAWRPRGLPADHELLRRRLFFPLTTPERAGLVELRCGIYHRGMLLQSRRIRARVMRRPTPRRGALVSRLDYSLSRTLDVRHVSRFPEHRLSVFFNRGADGSHTLSFLGAGETAEDTFTETSRLSAPALQRLVTLARGALRRAAWGDEDPWIEGKPYLYKDGGEPARLERDLSNLAVRGYKLYDGLVAALAGGEERAEELERLMRRHGTVQIAFKETAADVVPAALFYDRPLDTGLDGDAYRPCPIFAAALSSGRSLAATECFDGGCPTLDVDGANAELNLVCPSGFWGYRHALGMPSSVGEGGDGAPEIVLQGGATLGACVYPGFERLAEHRKRLEALRPDLGLRLAEDRMAAFRVMGEEGLRLVYFYCHGGESKSVPYLVLGAPPAGGGSAFIFPDNLRARRIRWLASHPLVFLNGCHTTALRPEQALQFVRPFIQYSRASGVIGTEITVFERLATRFAERCLERFLVDGEPIGEAVRGARLDLLQDRNPLGLVYIPFVHAGLHVVEAPGPAPPGEPSAV